MYFTIQEAIDGSKLSIRKDDHEICQRESLDRDLGYLM